MNRIFKVPEFDKYAQKIFEKTDFEELEIFIEKLRFNSNLGKPLGFDFLREKKIKGKRVYFLVYKEICLILFVATSNKKAQQRVINQIKNYLEDYKKYAYELHEKINKKN